MLDSLESYHSKQIKTDQQAQAIVQESEHHLREILDSVRCGIMVVDADTRRVLDVNTEGAALLKRNRGDIIGRICHRFVCLNERGQCPVVDLNQSIDLSQRKLLRADGTIIGCNRAFARMLGFDAIEEVRGLNASSFYSREFDRAILLERLQKEKKLDSLPPGTEAIVLVDDEADQVEVGSQMLSSLGYRVTGFTDSLQAMEYVLANPDQVRLVVTDMTMPQLTGASLATKLLEAVPDLPIVLCTGYSENITPEKAFELGIRGYVNKPVLLMDLARKIREILDGPTL